MSDSREITNDDSIPLCEQSTARIPILHQSRSAAESGSARPIRGKRHDARHHVENVLVCFSSHDASGRLDHADCPLVDVSREGVALVCDRRVTVGSRCFVSYRTISQQPVHIGGVVKNCARIDAARYRIGLLLDRHLQQDELKPAKARAGRSVSPVHHGRKLRGLDTDSGGGVEANVDTFRPNIREPSLGDGPDEYDLTPE